MLVLDIDCDFADKNKFSQSIGLQVVGVLPAITFGDVSAFFSPHRRELAHFYSTQLSLSLQFGDAIHEVHSTRYLELSVIPQLSLYCKKLVERICAEHAKKRCLLRLMKQCKISF